MMRHLTAVLSVVLILPALARAQALADRVPANALVYIGWAGTTGAADGYANSRLKAVVESGDAHKLFTETLPALAKRLGASNHDAGEAMSMILSLEARVARHPAAFYWQGVDFTNPRQPMPSFELMCDAGDEAPALAKDLQSAIDRAGQTSIPMKVVTDATTVSLLVGPVKSDAAAGAKLADDAQFKQTMAKVQPNPVAAVYVNLAGIVKLIDSAPPEGPNGQHDKQQWAKLKDALGLSSATSAAWSGAFDDRDWSSQAFIAAPAPRQGVFALLDARPVTDELLKLIPQTATMVAVRSFDASKLVTDIRSAAGKVDPNAPQSMNQALEQFHSMTGLDLEKDLLDPLGDQWACFADPNMAGSTSLCMCLMNKARDAAKADAGLTRLAQSIGRLASRSMRRDHMQLTVGEINHHGLTIHYFATPLIRPAWAVKDGVLYLGAYPQVVSAAVAITSAGGKSILDNDAFASLGKRLGDKPITAIEYVDLPRTAPMLYPSLLVVSGYAGFSDMFGVPGPAMLLPPLNDILAQMTPSASVAWVDDQGWHMHHVSPFPGAEAFGTDMAATVGTGALLTSILLPSLNRARETANRVKCASNERQIGQAILLYSNDHRGAYPPDLGTLIKTEDITVDVFVCPSSNNAVPPAVRVASQDVQAQWVNQHSSYVYVGKGMKNTVGAEQVVLYEKPEDHSHDGMNLLYGDGHVSWEQMPVAQKEIHQPAAPPQPPPPTPGL